MQERPNFKPIQRILIPFVHNGPGLRALEMARQFDAEIILVGVVVIPDEESLSLGAESARKLRRTLRAYSKSGQIAVRARVVVSHQPWGELYALAQKIKPDLLCMEFDEHLNALKISTSDALTRPPCDVALVRGRISETPQRVLTAVRGGPHAELAVRVGLGLRPAQMTSLHIRKKDEDGESSKSSFKALNQALLQIPEVTKKIEVTDLAAEAILKNAQNADIVIMGTTNDPLASSASLGYVADRVLREASCAVIAVKSGRPAPRHFDEESGYEAISILVDKWFAENTFHADEFSALDEMVALKKQKGLTVSLALPALNEEETVRKVIRTMKSSLMGRFPLLDEIVLIDSNSSDRTREIAVKEGVPVYIHQEILPRMGARVGKGEALWKSLLVTQGDIVAWIDTDIVNIHPRFVYGIVGPLLINSNIQFVKGFYRRPLRVGAKVQAGGGGRVTELTARPLLNLFYPELSGVVQPLSGEYAGRRKTLERSTFYSGYGVETGLLIDIYENFGLDAIAQVDLLERVHHNQPLEALGKMSFAIIQTVIRKLEKRFGRAVLEDVNRSMKLIRHNAKGYFLDVEYLPEYERPPMIEVPEYLQRKPSP